MRQVVVVDQTNTVVNVIVAEPKQVQPPDGCRFVIIGEGTVVGIGWKFDEQSGDFTDLLGDE